MKLPVLFLAGPTAVGKSAVALCLAEQLGGEILSVDSMQVYRGLDLGTAKPTADERQRVPHHLIDVVDLRQAFHAARFLELAEAAVSEISGRGRLPLFCGGTGLYFKVLLEGLGTSAAADPSLRRELEGIPLDALLEELAALDPAGFARVDRRNRRRVIRALEVVRLTGRPLNEVRSRWSAAGGRPAHPGFFALRRSGADLGRRIDSRVERMFARGLVEETRLLLARGLEGNRTALQAIGYRQVVEHLHGIRGLEATVALVKQRTRQFARRQMNWLRRHLPVSWVDVKPEEEAGAIARRIVELAGRAVVVSGGQAA